jgi:hypothetical protein
MLSGKVQFPERVKLELEDEINGFERTFNRLLSCFDNIETEAAEKRQNFLDRKSESFNPDRDDEACIEEDGYFIELNHVFIETTLKQEYINSIAVSLFHLFERQKNRIFDSAETDEIKPKLDQSCYGIDSCQNWKILNKELRHFANTVKHGLDSKSGKKLQSKYPLLFENGCLVLKRSDIERHLAALRYFWDKLLNGRVVL